MEKIVEAKDKKENVFTKIQKSVKDFNEKHPKIHAGLKYAAVLVGGAVAGVVYCSYKNAMQSVDADDPANVIDCDDPLKELNMDSDDMNADLSVPDSESETNNEI